MGVWAHWQTWRGLARPWGVGWVVALLTSGPINVATDAQPARQTRARRGAPPPTRPVAMMRAVAEGEGVWVGR